jgi:hypothetical protein
LRSLGPIATLIIAIAAILGISAGDAGRKPRQLLNELAGTQSALAKDAAHEFGARLDALGRDARILASLVSRTRSATSPPRTA